MSLCLTIFDPMDCSPPRPIPFSRGSSQSRDHTWNSCIAGRFFTIWATAKSPKFLFNSVPSSPRREHSPWLKARTFLSSSFYLFQLFFFFFFFFFALCNLWKKNKSAKQRTPPTHPINLALLFLPPWLLSCSHRRKLSGGFLLCCKPHDWSCLVRIKECQNCSAQVSPRLARKSFIDSRPPSGFRA